MSGAALVWGLIAGVGLLVASLLAYLYWPEPLRDRQMPRPAPARGNRGTAAIITAPVAWLLVGNALWPLGIILAFIGVMLGIMARERNDRMLGLWGLGIGLLAPAIVLGMVLTAWMS